MRKQFHKISLVFISFLLFSVASYAQLTQLKVINKSQWLFNEIQLTAAGTTEWSSNLITSATAPVEGTYKFDIECGTYDIRFVDTDNDVCIMRSIYICNEGHTVEFDDDKLLACQSSTTEAGEGDNETWSSLEVGNYNNHFVFTNNTTQNVASLYVSPSDADSWGEDILKGNLIAPNTTLTVYMNCNTFDIKFLIENQEQEYTKFGEEICSEGTNEYNFLVDDNFLFNSLFGEDDSDEVWASTTDNNSGAQLVVINNYSTNLRVINISPSSSSTWGKNIIAAAPIAPNQTMIFYLDCGEYDVKTIAENTTECYDYSNQFCKDDGIDTLIINEDYFYNCSSSSDYEEEEYVENTYASQEQGDYDSDFVIYNNTSKDIHYVHVSPTEDDWGGDILGESNVLYAEGTLHIYLNCGVYNIKIVDANSNDCYIYQVRICGDEQYSLNLNDEFLNKCRKPEVELTGDHWASLKKERKLKSYFIFRNNSQWDIDYLYISPEEDNWGDDILGSGTFIESNTEDKIYIKCGTYNIKMIDEDKDICIMENIEICSNDEEYIFELNDDNLLECQGQGEEESDYSSTEIWCSEEDDDSYSSFFKFKNTSSWRITELHISPSTSDYWGGDLLENANPINATDTRKFFINCDKYDFKIVNEGGSICYIYGEEICSDNGEYIFELTDDKIVECEEAPYEDYSEEEEGSENSWANTTGDGFESSAVLVNNSSFIINYLFISPETDDWGKDVLNYFETFAANSEQKVFLNCGTYNIKIETEDGSTCVFNDKELCNNQFIITNEMLYNCENTESAGETWATINSENNYSSSVTINNIFGKQIKSLYISPNDSDSWGDNILTNILESGASVKAFLNCGTYDVKITLINGTECTLMGVELCNGVLNISPDKFGECSE